MAIDWHLTPYYGAPYRSRNELYYGKPRQGTKQFHAYASACLLDHGERYTLALSWVRRHESSVVVLRRLLARLRQLGLKIKCVLLDRAFFNVSVVAFLKEENLPFLMPVVLRGRKPKKRRPATGLRWIKRQAAGWYQHTVMQPGTSTIPGNGPESYDWSSVSRNRMFGLAWGPPLEANSSTNIK